MGQPHDPYQNPGPGGPDPWGQAGPQGDWGQPSGPPVPGGQPAAWPQQPAPGYGAPPSDPWSAPPAAPAPGWPGQPQYPPPPPPPPPPKSNAGLILGVAGAVLVLLLVAGVGAVFLLRGGSEPEPVADSGASAGATASPSPSVSPTPATKDPESLDSKDTDETSLTTAEIFPDGKFNGGNGETYRLAGTLETDACTGVGSGRAKELLEKYDCDRMVVGVWLTSDEKLFSALLVVPLESKSDADALHSEIGDDRQKVIDSLTYYCPSDGEPGADQCEREADDLPTWYASFTTFHRYLFIAISLYTDGHRTDDMSDVDDMTTETAQYVREVLLSGD